MDSRYNALGVEQNADSTALEGVNTLTLDLSNLLQSEEHLFARIGVKTVGVEEMIDPKIAAASCAPAGLGMPQRWPAR